MRKSLALNSGWRGFSFRRHRRHFFGSAVVLWEELSVFKFVCCKRKICFLIFCFNDISLFWRENTVYRGMLIIYKNFFFFSDIFYKFLYLLEMFDWWVSVLQRVLWSLFFFFSCGKFCPVLVLQQMLPRWVKIISKNPRQWAEKGRPRARELKLQAQILLSCENILCANYTFIFCFCCFFLFL